MHLTMRMEQFSRAYVEAVAAVADFNIMSWAVDNDSIDVGFGTSKRHHARLEAQLKATYSRLKRDEKELRFPLSLKNYNDLRSDTCVPRILIVMAMPSQEPEAWIEQDSTRLVLMHCAWWRSLSGEPSTTNTDSVTVPIPIENIFSPKGLTHIMTRIDEKKGGLI